MNDVPARVTKAWGPIPGTIAFLAGLYVAFRLAAHLIYKAEDYQPGEADCDDCGITILLDNIGWLGLAFVGYGVIFTLVSYVLIKKFPSR